jgi:hypothetical protein
MPVHMREMNITKVGSVQLAQLQNGSGHNETAFASVPMLRGASGDRIETPLASEL